jgi:hypothetical protein
VKTDKAEKVKTLLYDIESCEHILLGLRHAKPIKLITNNTEGFRHVEIHISSFLSEPTKIAVIDAVTSIKFQLEAQLEEL